MSKVLQTTRRSFANDDGGVSAIEFSFIAPVLILLFLGSATLFFSFQSAQKCEKGIFTVADIISRRSEVNDDFLKKMYAMFEHMIPPTKEPVKLRVTSVSKASGKYKVDWSYAVAPWPKLATAAIPPGALPEIADGDSVVLIETEAVISLPSAIFGSGEIKRENQTAVRPRFVSAIAKTG
ncbi:TadE/TadG family type IV pilus assembly protein [Consotaella salsifontis]|uniref:TadE-like protein n=1 Tax=Consotaella salsifontis TaxID=1365950 RepID=A0A1T4MEY1_9HYPH|nr:TadE/TadG family type IV pilus assembly protein [Consotaella salsifontis]SJZ65589.1 TadE-like protein [Consotaella salsifontis]